MSEVARKNALIPFEAASGVLMIFIVAAMAFIACFALAAGLGASRVADTWTDGLAGAATVRIEAGDEDRARRVSLVLDILRNTEGVFDARPLPESDVAALLEPWFGGKPDLAELPTPTIIAVRTDPEREPDAAIVQARLDGAASGAVYDDHGRWRGRAKSAADSVRTLSFGALALAALAIAATVFLVVRVAMSSHRGTISALRLAGAEDRFVAGLYQIRYFWLGLIGGVLGCGVALAAIVGFDAMSKINAALPALETPSSWPMMLLAIIGFVIVIAVLSARIAVMTALRARA